jgi:hypothetical protein
LVQVSLLVDVPTLDFYLLLLLVITEEECRDLELFPHGVEVVLHHLGLMDLVPVPTIAFLIELQEWVTVAENAVGAILYIYNYNT